MMIESAAIYDAHGGGNRARMVSGRLCYRIITGDGRQDVTMALCVVLPGLNVAH